MPNYLLVAELANSGKLPSGALFALVPLLVLVIALDVYCLIDLARAKSVCDATSVEAGERGIPAVLAACGARQVSCEPRAADLESAFLALTGASS